MALRRRSVLAATVVAAAGLRKPARAAPTPPADDDIDPDAFRPLSAITRIDPPKTLPDLAFTGLDGASHPLAAYRGRPVVLNFWATWCTPCVKEMPALDRLAASDPNLTVLAVSADHGGASVVRPFAAAHRITHATVLLDPESSAVHTLEIAGFPTTLILDAQGRLRGKLEGPADWGKATQAITALVG